MNETPEPPIACTLDAEAMPDRLADWKAVLAKARLRTVTADGGVRVEFDETIDVSNLARLSADEQHCCAFFSFAITIDARGVALEVSAPDDANDIVSALFGS